MQHSKLQGFITSSSVYSLLTHSSGDMQICLSHFSQPTFEGLPEQDQDWLTTQVTPFARGLQHHIFADCMLPGSATDNSWQRKQLLQDTCHSMACSSGPTLYLLWSTDYLNNKDVQQHDVTQVT